MTQKIFITGAAGFIGYHLASHLQSQGASVVGFDNFNTYYTPSLKRERASRLKSIGVEVIEGDICDRARLLSAVKEHKTTHIVHLAAQAGVRYASTHPEEYIHSNMEGFQSVLEVCRSHPVKLVFASSSSVYGRNEKTPFAEADKTEDQESLYGVTKKSNELVARAYNRLYGIESTGLRFFTVYGPWGRPDMAYYSFTMKIMEGQPIDVYNHGQLARDFTYIDDIVSGIVAALQHVRGYNIYNLGNDRPVQLLDFIRTLEGALGKKAMMNMMPMQAGDVVTTWADLTLSREKLGYQPQVDLQEGLKRFVAWYREQEGAPWHG